MTVVVEFVGAVASKFKMPQCLSKWASSSSSSCSYSSSLSRLRGVRPITAAVSLSQFGHNSSPWDAGSDRLKKTKVEANMALVKGVAKWHVGAVPRKDSKKFASTEKELQGVTSEPLGAKATGEEEEEEEEKEEEEEEEEDTQEEGNRISDELEDVEEEEIEVDDDVWEDEEKEDSVAVGDGGDGGGFVFDGSTWGDKALKIAEDVLASFGGDLVLYAFKVKKGAGEVLVRLDKLSNKYGSPTIEDIDQFSAAYGAQLEEAVQAGLIPDNLALEVSSPGAERFLRVPQDLVRFKGLPMQVRYFDASSEGDSQVKLGVLDLQSVDLEAGSCTWTLANVRVNRELAGKGRGLSRKQRLWKIDLPFSSLLDVRLYIDI